MFLNKQWFSLPCSFAEHFFRCLNSSRSVADDKAQQVIAESTWSRFKVIGNNFLIQAKKPKHFVYMLKKEIKKKPKEIKLPSFSNSFWILRLSKFQLNNSNNSKWLKRLTNLNSSLTRSSRSALAKSFTSTRFDLASLTDDLETGISQNGMSLVKEWIVRLESYLIRK